MTDKKHVQATIERHRARGAHPDNANAVSATDHQLAMAVRLGHHKPAPAPLGVGPEHVAAAQAEVAALHDDPGEAEHEDKSE